MPIKNSETSIIIRTRNEERWLGRVLEKLHSQTYKDFEIIIVDSGSTDKTLTIAAGFPEKFIRIKPEEFSYPYALNLGIKNSSGQKFLCFLSAHSLPVSDRWLESGIRHLTDEKAMGVYGPLKALPDGTFWDKIFYESSYWKEWLACRPQRYRKVKRVGLGVMGFTNAIIRRDLWEKRNFNEAFGGGGEDGEWADYWFNRGYHAIKDIDFAVYHSHYLNFSQWIEQKRHWKSTARPQTFKYLKFRNEGAHQDASTIQAERH